MRLTARSPWTGFSPALNQDGFSNKLQKSFHVARIQKTLTYRIEHRDYSESPV